MDTKEELIKTMIQQLLLNNSENYDSKKPEFHTLGLLKQKAGILLEEPNDFKQGDIVEWKQGLKNRRFPKENQPCYVVEVLDKPYMLEDVKEAGTPYYREPLDLVLALLNDDAELLVFHYDKRRFKLVEESDRGKLKS